VLLSGTPIQNNVLELWSIFDFLMPGFLGTEKQFNQQYSKPITKMRDAKAKSKAQEVRFPPGFPRIFPRIFGGIRLQGTHRGLIHGSLGFREDR